MPRTGARRGKRLRGGRGPVFSVGNVFAEAAEAFFGDGNGSGTTPKASVGRRSGSRRPRSRPLPKKRVCGGCEGVSQRLQRLAARPGLGQPHGMAEAARKRATYEDLLALPPNVKGEILDGVLYTQPKPRAPHMRAATILGGNISGPFDSGWSGPGGWWILIEPGIELPDSPEVIPDLAGWRRERMPELPRDEAITVVPDWVCEILSPSTRNYDQRIKKPFYARHGVSWLWLVDPEAHLLTAHRLENGRWVEMALGGRRPRADRAVRRDRAVALGALDALGGLTSAVRSPPCGACRLGQPRTWPRLRGNVRRTRTSWRSRRT